MIFQKSIQQKRERQAKPRKRNGKQPKNLKKETGGTNNG